MSEYAGYLSNLKEKATVTTIENIVSDQGVLIAKSGIELNAKNYENILKFKLLKPLEDSIAISNQLTAKLVYNHIIQLIKADPWLSAINEKMGEKVILQRCCLNLDQYPLLLQKLTVLKMEIPDVFNQSILSAYLSYICGVTDHLEQGDINHHFLAGISHDIGFLHIDRNILLKKTALDADEWRKIQSHPVIAYEILKRMDNFPKEACKAVLEHHENLNGTGYPRSKTSTELSYLGQLINLIDNVIAIYNKKFKPLHRSLRGIMPIIQINMHSYFPEAVSVILRTLKQAPESPIESSEDGVLKALIEHVQKEQAYIQSVIDMIRNHNDTLGFVHENQQIYAIQNIAINIIMITNSAGLSDSSYSDWLNDLSSSCTNTLYNEVEDTRIMIDEVIYQLQTYQKAANLFVSRNPGHPLTPKVASILENFKHFNCSPPPALLKAHWKTLSNAK